MGRKGESLSCLGVHRLQLVLRLPFRRSVLFLVLCSVFLGSYPFCCTFGKPASRILWQRQICNGMFDIHGFCAVLRAASSWCSFFPGASFWKPGGLLSPAAASQMILL